MPVCRDDRDWRGRNQAAGDEVLAGQPDVARDGGLRMRIPTGFGSGLIR